MRRYLLTLVGVGLIAACADAASDSSQAAALTAEDEAAIRALLSDWEAAWESNDVAAVTSLYTEDFFEARATAVEGRDAALELYQGFTSTYTSVSGTVLRLEGSGSLALMQMRFENELTNAEGVARIQTGNALWSFRKNDAGEWRVSAAGWSSSTRDAPTGD